MAASGKPLNRELNSACGWFSFSQGEKWCRSSAQDENSPKLDFAL